MPHPWAKFFDKFPTVKTDKMTNVWQMPESVKKKRKLNV